MNSKKKRTPLFPYTGVLTGYYVRTKNYQVWRPKGTNDWLAIYTVSGHGRFGFNEGEVQTRAGDIVLLKPGTVHDYGLVQTPGHWEIWWAHFHPEPDWAEWLQWPEEAPGLMRVHFSKGRLRQTVEDLWEEMHRHAISRRPLGYDLAANALEGVLLRCTSQVWEHRDLLDERARRAQEFLADHLMKQFSLAETAQHVGLSPSRLAHLFREETGATPRAYHERLKIDRATELLRRTGQSVSEIAYGLGFESVFYFSRRFKQATGASPRAFRESGVIKQP